MEVKGTEHHHEVKGTGNHHFVIVHFHDGVKGMEHHLEVHYHEVMVFRDIRLPWIWFNISRR